MNYEFLKYYFKKELYVENPPLNMKNFIEEELDIKLLKNDLTYSLKKGFIGGCISRIENKVIIFGDLDRIDKNSKISNFIKNRGLEIIDFKGLDVVDYGGIVVI